MAPTLKTTVTRIEFENPFLLGSGPPGTNAKVIAKSFDLGWGGVVGKTISLDASKVVNTAPRYGKLKDREKADTGAQVRGCSFDRTLVSPTERKSQTT